MMKMGKSWGEVGVRTSEILERERGKTKGAKGRFEALLHVFDLLF